MIYYQNEFVDWKRNKSDLEKEVRVQIENLRLQYFAKDKMGFVSIVYPGGIRKQNPSGFYEMPRTYALELRGGDYGDWRFTPRMPARDKNGNLRFTYHHEYMREARMLTEKDIEFLWFLIFKSQAVKVGDIIIVDPENEASKEAEAIAKDVDLKFWLYGRGSHVANNQKLVRSISKAFGLNDVDKLGFNQVKNQLFKVVDAGEKSRDVYVNAALFEKLIDSTGSLKIANVIREGIGEGNIVYNKSNTSWFFDDGSDDKPMLLKLKPADIASKEMALISEAIESSRLKNKILAYMGYSEFSSADELREMDRPALMRMCKDREIEYGKNDTGEELVVKLCAKMDIPYTPK